MANALKEIKRFIDEIEKRDIAEINKDSIKSSISSKINEYREFLNNNKEIKQKLRDLSKKIDEIDDEQIEIAKLKKQKKEKQREKEKEQQQLEEKEGRRKQIEQEKQQEQKKQTSVAKLSEKEFLKIECYYMASTKFKLTGDNLDQIHVLKTIARNTYNSLYDESKTDLLYLRLKDDITANISNKQKKTIKKRKRDEKNEDNSNTGTILINGSKSEVVAMDKCAVVLNVINKIMNIYDITAIEGERKIKSIMCVYQAPSFINIVKFNNDYESETHMDQDEKRQFNGLVYKPTNENGIKKVNMFHTGKIVIYGTDNVSIEKFAKKLHTILLNKYY